MRKAERDLVADEAGYTTRKQQKRIGIGESVLSWGLGRRSTRAFSSAASRRRMTSTAGQVLAESRAEIDDLQ